MTVKCMLLFVCVFGTAAVKKPHRAEKNYNNFCGIGVKFGSMWIAKEAGRDSARYIYIYVCIICVCVCASLYVAWVYITSTQHMDADNNA